MAAEELSTEPSVQDPSAAERENDAASAHQVASVVDTAQSLVGGATSFGTAVDTTLTEEASNLPPTDEVAREEDFEAAIPSESGNRVDAAAPVKLALSAPSSSSSPPLVELQERPAAQPIAAQSAPFLEETLPEEESSGRQALEPISAPLAQSDEPVPDPAPSPDPAPTPTPDPSPEPTPDPSPSPDPSPTPTPDSSPSPESVPIDKQPLAVADTSEIEEDAVSVSGSVIGNDTLGDGGSAENVVTLDDPASGSYGTIVLNGDGSYLYTLDNSNALVQQLSPGETLSEEYRYTVTDEDGDRSQAKLTITIRGTDDGVAVTNLDSQSPELVLDEAYLDNGSSPDEALLIKSGTFSFTSPDGVLAVRLGNTDLILNGTYVGDVNGGVEVVGSAYGNLTITDFAPTIAGDEIVGGTFSYNYELSSAVDHSADSAQDAIVESLAVIVTDVDGDQSISSLDIRVLDDAPLDFDPVGLSTQNAPLPSPITKSLDLDSSLLNNSGADGIAGLAFSVEDGDPVLSAEGNQLTYLSDSGSVYNLVYQVANSELLSAVAVDGSGSAVATVFTLSLDQSTTQYTFNLLEPVGSSLHFDISDFTPVGLASGKQLPSFELSSIPGTPSSILFSNGTQGNEGVLVSEAGVGIGDVSTDPSEVLRLDFVDHANLGADGDYYDFGRYQEVNNFYFGVSGITPVSKKGGDSTVSITIAALDALNPDLADPSGTFTKDHHDGLSGSSTIHEIHQAWYWDPSVSALTDRQWLLIYSTDPSDEIPDFYPVQASLGDNGSITVHGITDNSYVKILAEGSGFNALTIQNADITAKTADAFDIGDIGFTMDSDYVISPETNLRIPLELTDSDGDSVFSDIDVRLTSAVTQGPIALDLNSDGVISHLSTLDSAVSFDYGSGLAPTAWVGSADGLLVYDYNADASITEDREFVFTRWGTDYNVSTDAQALAAYFDTNQDGLFDASDHHWSSFGVWQDFNADGISQVDEFNNLAYWGIESIALTYDRESYSYLSANGGVEVFGQLTVSYSDGSTGLAEDLAFRVGEADSSMPVSGDLYGIDQLVSHYLSEIGLSGDALTPEILAYQMDQAVSDYIDVNGLSVDQYGSVLHDAYTHLASQLEALDPNLPSSLTVDPDGDGVIDEQAILAALDDNLVDLVAAYLSGDGDSSPLLSDLQPISTPSTVLESFDVSDLVDLHLAGQGTVPLVDQGPEPDLPPLDGSDGVDQMISDFLATNSIPPDILASMQDDVLGQFEDHDPLLVDESHLALDQDAGLVSDGADALVALDQYSDDGHTADSASFDDSGAPPHSIVHS